MTEETITPEGLATIGNGLFPKGTLLMAMYGSIGKLGIAGTDLATNQAILGFEISDKSLLDRDYLRYWLEYINPTLVRNAEGVTQKNLSATRVRNLKIPLPPLPAQRRIAAVLDKADALRRKRRQALARLDDLLQSVFLDMFGDPVTNPYGFPRRELGDLVSETQYGTGNKATTQGAYPVLRMGNLTYSGGLDFSDLKYSDIQERDLHKHLVFKGDILFNRTNSKELVGKTAVYRENEPMAYAGYLIRVRPNNKAHAEYVAAHLNTDYGKAVLRHMCKNIIGMANINAQELRTVPILEPPLELQAKYALWVNAVTRTKARLSESLARTSSLFGALIQKAFRGELSLNDEQLLAPAEPVLTPSVDSPPGRQLGLFTSDSKAR